MDRKETGNSGSLPESAPAQGGRGTFLSRGVNWLRKALAVITLAYGVVLVPLLIGLHWQGEHLGVLSLLLYAPIQGLLLPLVALSPLALFLRPRLLFWHALFAVLVVFLYMGFRWSFPPKATSTTITAVTFNFGESSLTQFMRFLAEEKPDLIILQDASGREGYRVPKIPGMQISQMGEFALFSRFPIRNGKFVDGALDGGRPIATRWEVTIQDRDVAIYSVHMPTPRRELLQFLGRRRVVAGLVGNGNRQPGFGDYREWMHERIELARSLAKVFAMEEKPMIVGGDFNTPNHGYIYHLFSAEMTDAFAETGRGWGLTFPGSTRNPLSLFGPWLRIDYFFTGRGWKAIECRPEPGRRSQHKAVVARFEPVPMP